MKTQEHRKKTMLSAGVVLLITFAVWWTEKKNVVLTSEGYLMRPENGQGDYEAELILEVDETEETEMWIVVPEQFLAAKEEEILLTEAIAEIEKEFVGENDSLENVVERIMIREVYQKGKVTAEWEFSKPGLFDENGFIVEEAMIADCEMIQAKVYLSCEDSNLIHEFCFVAYKQKKSEEEIFYEKLNQLISENGETEGTEFLWLPTDLEGRSLVWKNKESHLPIQVFCIGMFVVLMLPALEAERMKEAQKKKEEQLLREYPDLVNKLALLLGAGMTLKNAWCQIVAKYIEERANGQREPGIVYEEMLITQREMESGQGERKAYEAFGKRCGLPQYRKLCNYLIQNMKKGNRGLCELLEQEATEAFANRKNMAQQYGEEVGTKLLLPMLMMLGIVIFVIMVPAVISFQSGVN